MRAGNGERLIVGERKFFPKRFSAALVQLLAIFRNKEQENLFFGLSNDPSN